jgi:hypothetical protein
MTPLLDKDIREIFTVHYTKRYPKSKLLNEVRINNGLAIADLVSVGIRNLHCYEIKSDKDKITRVLEQSKSYDIVFNKISLITTQTHYNKALDIIPPYWGIIVVSNTQKIKIHYRRKASISPLFSNKNALFTLWRNELLGILLMKKIIEKPKSKSSRSELINIICERLSTTDICELMNASLINREHNYKEINWFRSNPSISHLSLT